MLAIGVKYNYYRLIVDGTFLLALAATAAATAMTKSPSVGWVFAAFVDKLTEPPSHGSQDVISFMSTRGARDDMLTESNNLSLSGDYRQLKPPWRSLLCQQAPRGRSA